MYAIIMENPAMSATAPPPLQRTQERVSAHRNEEHCNGRHQSRNVFALKRTSLYLNWLLNEDKQTRQWEWSVDESKEWVATVAQPRSVVRMTSQEARK